MISLEDCVALSGLTEEQVLAIAEHEHLPEIAATALAQYLSNQAHGMEKIRDMIVDDVRQAQQRQDKAHILTELVARVRPLTVSAIGLEPSGGYERGNHPCAGPFHLQ